MKQTIEEIIKKNLPEPAKGIEKVIENTEQDRIYNLLNENMVIGFNQAISQIDTSLIADEVLKVIIRKIEEIETFEPEDDFVDGGDMEYASRRLAVDNSRRWGEIKIKTDILQLLSNLSSNKENENNG